MLFPNNSSVPEDLPDDLAILTFESFVLDRGRGVLMRNGVEIPLRPKAFDVLAFLLWHSKRLVSRETLMESVWPNVIVTDNSLTQCLIEIRKALGDETHTLVKTVPRRGYMFDGDVTASVPSDPGAGESPRRNSTPAWGWLFGMVATLILVVGLSWWLMPQKHLVNQHESTADELRNPEAWNLYLRGNYFRNRRMEGDSVLAQRFYEEALVLDPNLAKAWVSLASILRIRNSGCEASEPDCLSKAATEVLIRQALEKAIALDPEDPNALILYSRILWNKGDKKQSMEQINRAMHNGRNNALVQSILAGLAFQYFEPKLAADLQARAVSMDPVSATHRLNLAVFLFMAGELDASRQAIQQAVAFNPDWEWEVKESLTQIYILQKQLQKAESLAESLPAGSFSDMVWAMLHHAAGRGEVAKSSLDRLVERRDVQSQIRVAEVYSEWGDRDAAFQALDGATEFILASEQLSQERDWVTFLRWSPFLQQLQSDSRWAEWVTKIDDYYQDPFIDEFVLDLKKYAANQE